MRIPSPVAILREMRRKREKTDEVENLYRRLKESVNSCNDGHPSFPVGIASSGKEIRVEHVNDVEEQLEIIHEAYMVRDRDALNVYSRFAPDDRICTKQSLKETMESIRRTGQYEVNFLECSDFQNAGRIRQALIAEHPDHASKMLNRLSSHGNLQYAMMAYSLMYVCALGPKPVTEYLLEDTRRALKLVSERNLVVRDELIDVMERIITTDTPALVDGML